jgi:hypothetical protein
VGDDAGGNCCEAALGAGDADVSPDAGAGEAIGAAGATDDDIELCGATAGASPGAIADGVDDNGVAEPALLPFCCCAAACATAARTATTTTNPKRIALVVNPFVILGPSFLPT